MRGGKIRTIEDWLGFERRNGLLSSYQVLLKNNSVRKSVENFLATYSKC